MKRIVGLVLLSAFLGGCAVGPGGSFATTGGYYGGSTFPGPDSREHGQ